MSFLSRIAVPAAMMAVAALGTVTPDRDPVRRRNVPVFQTARDTVVYPLNGYRLRRSPSQQMDVLSLDSLARADAAEADSLAAALDTLPHLSARDTIKVPDSLRLTDPFRYKYYVALLDSLTHRQVSDSLRNSMKSLFESGDTLLARMDSLDWRKLDSIYVADSTVAAKARFAAWYASLDKYERKKYDAEQKSKIMMARMDSLRIIKEEKQAIRDSITENTPRILETFAIPDSLQYKRVITWTVDPDFQKMDVKEIDTTYNYHYYDYPFQNKDVNATWLGMAGSPVQFYNVLQRDGASPVDFYKAYEPWSHGVADLPHYNTKTPYTELAYYGTLLNRSKESDNLHLFTTQNILPELNFAIMYERFGGEGILARERTVNNNLVAQINYTGKKYLMHVGYIRNVVDRQENGGITDPTFVRDTTLEAREIPINLSNAESKTTKNTVFLDQQIRIPFNFINKIKAKKDSTFSFNADSLDRNITTAFLGHSSELSFYNRKYTDKISSAAESAFYNDVFNIGDASSDSLRTLFLDNKVFLRLQPWSSTAAVSKLDVGIGDCFKNFYSPYLDEEGSLVKRNISQNNVYAYAGAEGQVRDLFLWDAKAKMTFIGADAGDFSIRANAMFRFYPFRRAKKSPLSIKASFETGLRNPDYYQQHMLLNHYKWDNEFKRSSKIVARGEIDIPYWGLKADVGYSMLTGKIYYDTLSVIRQCEPMTGVLSASLMKNFKLGIVHLDNKVLIQHSTNKEVVPVPLAAFNLRYYLQFVAQWDPSRTKKILEMQIGVNVFFNTKWNSPAWNPNLGVFFNQNKLEYNNGPYFDVFLNMQWQRCCIFVKYQNAGMGWPMKKADYFSADRYIVTTSGLPGLKFGIFWPFYINPKGKGSTHNHGGGLGGGLKHQGN